MGNTQEAIEEYEKQTSDARRVDIAKIITPDENKCVTMILDFKYEDRDCCYLAQRLDGKQKWVWNPDMDIWGPLIEEYWSSSRSNSEEDKP